MKSLVAAALLVVAVADAAMQPMMHMMPMAAHKSMDMMGMNKMAMPMPHLAKPMMHMMPMYAPESMDMMAMNKKAMPMHLLAKPMAEARWGQPGHPMSREADAEIVEKSVDMSEPGRYMYSFRTNNGIAMMEQFAMDKDVAKVQGAYEWTSPEGENYKVEYVADDMGYRPVGAHLPKVPLAILRSLEWNAAHPEEDMDGKYHDKMMMEH